MRLKAGALLSALADQLSAPVQRSRRYWVGHGRAHIEVKGVRRPQNAGLARQVEDELARLKAVEWAEVNAVVGRVVVAFDSDYVSVEDLIEVIEGVEEAHGLAAERFAQDRPEHPADTENVLQQAYAIGAEIGGIGLSLVGRAVGASPLPAEAASVISLVDATPALRRLAEHPLGAATADLTLAVSNAVAQGLAQGPLGLVVDIMHRSLRFAEARAGQQTWDGREPELHDQRGGDPLPALSGAGRPVPLPSGPVESAADRAAQAALAVAAATGAATRDVRTVLAATVAGTPKAARLGREAFAAWLGRDMARAGILAMDTGALRRLDRVDAVVLDARVLATGRTVLGSVWVAPDYEQDAEQVRLTAQALHDPASPAAVMRRGSWVLGPVPGGLSGPARKAARRLRAPGTHLLAVRYDNALAGLVAAVPELDPLAEALATGAGLSAVTGAVTDAALIGGVMMANAVVGGIQRVGADRALRRLIDESAVRVRVRRGSAEVLTTADQLVTGDVISLQAGDAVPADCRVLEAQGVEVDESSLTGESQLVPKSAEPTAAATIAERPSMLYAGTSLAVGTATAAVVAVGPATELGRSAEAARATRRPSGVQERLAQLTRRTVPISLGAGVAVVLGGMLRGRPVSQTLGTGVSLAVAAVPEGLPFVATVAELSTARRLSRRNALVRNPGTIEALGRVDVLCFDKTGTLTEGRIVLHRVWAAGHGRPLDALGAEGRSVLAAALRASPEHRSGERLAHPADRAVVAGGDAAGVRAELGADDWRLVEELPFESSRGYHAVLGETRSGNRIAVKGAPETVLPMCSHQQATGGPVRLDEAARQALCDEADRLARRGYRVLAVAERDASRRPLETDRIGELAFAGLLAFTDPVRDSAARAAQRLPCAGIRMMMLTGDHPSTAKAIATELDIIDGGKVMTGPELEELTDARLDQVIGQVGVFARVSPEQKVRIVAALQRTGHVVAVTGDGANDAPAIRLADVGVALGLRGTNAAKEAADVVVTDDRIETIIDAIVEGRAMWTSVRDAISVLLGGNLGEIAFTTGTGLLLPGGSPLNARQLLLVNMLTDMAPSMALAMRPPATSAIETLLTEGPDASLGAALTRDIVTRAAVTSGAGAAAWLGGRMTGVSQARAGTVALVGIVGAQLGQTLLAGWHSPPVVFSSLGSAAVLFAVIQTPGVSQFFGCRPLGPLGWGIGTAASVGATAMAPVMSRATASVQLPGAQARPYDAAANQAAPQAT